MALSFKEVAEIMKIIDSSSCEELELEAEDMRLVVRRGGHGSVSHAPSETPFRPAVSNNPMPQPAAVAPVSGDAIPVHGGGEAAHIEKAPMVGTFYRRSSPDEPPFVELGSKVAAGDPLCMIEVMKLYTTISASVDGVVDAILVDDAALVEFDQPLLVIRPV